ncbi:hypothetical protein Fmac_028536 [Flemingia macrophylla]|uniref:Uncharacterized protein n=1 Tax=Flemingia macrophylla TaxID=520843 RepID=A0ABD1L7S9_9FABA
MAPNPEQFSARNDGIVIRGVHDVATDTSAENRNMEGMLDVLMNLQSRMDRNPESYAANTYTGPPQQQRQDTYAETSKLDGMLDALLNLVTQLAANQNNLEWMSIMRLMLQTPIADHYSSRYKALDREDGSELLALDDLVNLVTQLAVDQKPAPVGRFCGIRSSDDQHKLPYILLRRNLEWMNILRLMLQTPIADHQNSKDKALDREDGSQLLAKARGQATCSCELGDSASCDQKPTSAARVCGIRSFNDHHTSVCPSSQQSGVHEHPEAYASKTYNRAPQQGVHDVAKDTFAETRKLEGKLDALVNLVTQLAANQKPASVARVCGIRSSNDHHTSVCPSSQQSGVDEHPAANATKSARNDDIAIRGVHDVATGTSAETRKLEGKLAALVNLTTTATENRHLIEKMAPNSEKFNVRNDVIVIRGVHDVAIDTFAETRKLGGKLDAFVNLVTQLTTNQKPASVARVCGIRSSNDHHTSVCPSSQQSGFSARNDNVATDTSAETRKLEGKLDAFVNLFSGGNDVIVIRGVHDVDTDTSAETRKLEGKLDALVNFLTQLAVNQKPASVARVCGIRSSIDHHTRFYPSSQQSGVDEAKNDAVVIRGVHDVATDTSAETRNLEGNLDALVNLVTQLAANQKPVSVARVCGILSSNDHHTSTTTAAETRHLIEKMAPNSKQFSARNDAIVIRGVHDMATDTSIETRKLEGNLDALVILTTTAAETRHLIEKMAPNSKLFSARNDVIVIRGVHDMDTDTSVETRKLEGNLEALVILFSARNDAIVNKRFHDVATDTSAETRKLEGKLDTLVNLQSGVDEQPEAYATNTYSRPPQL